MTVSEERAAYSSSCPGLTRAIPLGTLDSLLVGMAGIRAFTPVFDGTSPAMTVSGTKGLEGADEKPAPPDHSL